MHGKNQDTNSKRRRITKTEAAHSLMELHSSLVSETERTKLSAAYTLLDLENPCNRNENSTEAGSTGDINNEYKQVDPVVTTVENTENIKFKDVETQVNTMVNIKTIMFLKC